MTTRPEKPDHIGQDAWDAVDVPEATDAEFAAARPFSEVHPDLYASWKRGRGRPKVEQPKVQLALRMAADVVAAVKATGKGYNIRLEKLIREALAKGQL